jgi:hypothetical protein
MQCRADDAVAGLRKDLAEIGRTLADTMPRHTEDAVVGLRKDLAEIGRTLDTMPRRTEDAVAGLRKDLAEISRTLADAMPRHAVEALETEVRALAGRLDTERRAGVDASALAGVEQGLREVRDELRGLAPAESLVGFDKALKIVESKIDQIAAGRQDPAGLQQLEGAIASLRDVMGQVASSDALAALAEEVRGLADRIERGVPVAGGVDILDALDQRIGEAGQIGVALDVKHVIEQKQSLVDGGLVDRHGLSFLEYRKFVSSGGTIPPDPADARIPALAHREHDTTAGLKGRCGRDRGVARRPHSGVLRRGAGRS